MNRVSWAVLSEVKGGDEAAEWNRKSEKGGRDLVKDMPSAAPPRILPALCEVVFIPVFARLHVLIGVRCSLCGEGGGGRGGAEPGSLWHGALVPEGADPPRMALHRLEQGVRLRLRQGGQGFMEGASGAQRITGRPRRLPLLCPRRPSGLLAGPQPRRFSARALQTERGGRSDAFSVLRRHKQTLIRRSVTHGGVGGSSTGPAGVGGTATGAFRLQRSTTPASSRGEARKQTGVRRQGRAAGMCSDETGANTRDPSWKGMWPRSHLPPALHLQATSLRDLRDP
ncbi:hypothetical protein NDU88_001798 [Pleurodeles waltl]|uniref:Uncharacterized protein n=1 Tax=Pleurodeles waltl TaxID=8319 RepID=A0AAV7M464_PLEWA|nr:hypothetical protein NDU88_001798 [Pleurodeles waltl]